MFMSFWNLFKLIIFLGTEIAGVILSTIMPVYNIATVLNGINGSH